MHRLRASLSDGDSLCRYLENLKLVWWIPHILIVFLVVFAALFYVVKISCRRFLNSA